MPQKAMAVLAVTAACLVASNLYLYSEFQTLSNRMNASIVWTESDVVSMVDERLNVVERHRDRESFAQLKAQYEFAASVCSGQLIPDSVLSFSSATTWMHTVIEVAS
jgi:hypothetical protein